MLHALVTDIAQGRPDGNTICRFVSVMPHWDFNAKNWYTVIHLRLELKAWDPATRSVFLCHVPWQGVVDKILVPVPDESAVAEGLATKGKGKGKGKGHGKGKGQGRVYQI